jgi:outer membrane lipoprotein
MKKFAYYLVVLFITGCASKAPAPVSRVPAGNVAVAEVRLDIGRFIGTEVRWGGVISKVENKATQTWIEIVSRELRKNAQPREQGASGGRFIASFKGFVDPMVYKEGYLLTVLGTIEGQEVQPIGEYQYSFPVVSVSASHLWPLEPEAMKYEYPDPWWYEPWPFYPWPYPPYYW